jgi:hypothetical protein
VSVNIDHLLNIPCTITHVSQSGAADVYGNPTESTTTTDTVCWLSRGSHKPDERSGEAAWQFDTLDLFLPVGTTIDGDDRVTARDITYDVIGPPWDHPHPVTGDAVYIQAMVRVAT